jgi:hypothetical protein
MSKKIVSHYLNELAAINDRHAQEIDALAVKVRTEVILPYCEKHGYDFVAGMGTWLIGPVGGKPIESEDLPKWLVELLDMEVTEFGRTCLGDRIEDVRI